MSCQVMVMYSLAINYIMSAIFHSYSSFLKKNFCAYSLLFWPLIVTSNMYMLKQHTLDLKTDKGLFNSSQIITIAGLALSEDLVTSRIKNVLDHYRAPGCSSVSERIRLWQWQETICFEKIPNFRLSKRSNPTRHAYL